MGRHAGTIAALLCVTGCVASNVSADEGGAWASGVWPPTRLGRKPSVPPGKWGKKWGTIEYGHKVEHCALDRKSVV